MALLLTRAASVVLNWDINLLQASEYSDGVIASLLYAVSKDSVARIIEYRSAKSSKLFLSL